MSTSSPDQFRNSEAYYHLILERVPPRAEPAFDSPEMQERVWGRSWGVHNDVGRLRLCAVHRPGDEVNVIDLERYDPSIGAFIDDDEQWYWRDSNAPNLALMQEEHDRLVETLHGEGVEVVYNSCPAHDSHAVFQRDSAITIKGGAVITRMGLVSKSVDYGRRGEEAYTTRLLARLGMPILLTVQGTGLFEGGSFTFLNETTGAVGMAPRQNESGVRQLENVLAEQGVRVIRVPLTGFAMHLDGAFMMVDHDKALINVPQLPYWFLDTLKELDIQPIRIWPTDRKAINCLAVRPGRVIMPTGCPRTVERLNNAGVETIEIPYDEILKNGGGIHCSTLPLVRDRD